jgi:glycolate oxidase
MHPLILFDANSADGLHKAEALGADILRLCVEMGGCLTGRARRRRREARPDGRPVPPEDLEAQMRVKDAFDPDWLLNPAKVFRSR